MPDLGELNDGEDLADVIFELEAEREALYQLLHRPYLESAKHRRVEAVRLKQLSIARLERMLREALIRLGSATVVILLFLTFTATAHAKRPLPHWWKQQALCVHSHEGSWRDPGAPYYGGMQMDWSFMYTYGRHLLRTKGTADHWTPREQLRVAYRGWRERGWWPWRNTARKCGLL